MWVDLLNSPFNPFILLSLCRCSRDGWRIHRTREPRCKNRIQDPRSPRADYRLPRHLRCLPLRQRHHDDEILLEGRRHFSSNFPRHFLWTVFVITSSIFITLSALYSDWCLGLMLGDLRGVPSSDNAPLYWTYFAAKRLSMLSW